jgi:RecJ-like exonuclease
VDSYMGAVNEFLSRAKYIAEQIKKEKKVKVLSHIDADGICAASIAVKALQNANIEYDVQFVKQFDNAIIEKLKNENPPMVWITDLGSGSIHLLGGINAVVTDHHAPSQLSIVVPREKRKDLKTFFEEIERAEILHLNPHLFGKNGATDISGAGTTYLIAREMDKKNVEMSAMAIVGAVGDLQDTVYSRLTGTNRIILKESKEHGYIDYFTDARFFGKETRPIYKMLQYSMDPVIPTISNDQNGAIQFLEKLNIPLKNNENWVRWIDISIEDKRKILSELAILLLKMGYGSLTVERLIGEVYILSKENSGTPLRDAKEYATLLNSCGRYDQAEIGLNVALGDREEYYKKAITLLNKHRKTIVDSINVVKDVGIVKLEKVQYFHAGNNIPETVVGTVASMALSSGIADPDIPIIGFAETDNGMIKVSVRAPRGMVDRGLDLSEVMSYAAKQVGGYGGGHNVAAGASIPRGREDEFITIVNIKIGKMIEKVN